MVGMLWKPEYLSTAYPESPYKYCKPMSQPSKPNSNMMETSLVHWGYIGMLAKKMETTIVRGYTVL